jgi:hypothetical protein
LASKKITEDKKKKKKKPVKKQAANVIPAIPRPIPATGGGQGSMLTGTGGASSAR